MNFETIRVKPITYKLNVGEEILKKLRPVFQVSSESYSYATTTSKDVQGQPTFDENVRLKREEKGHFEVTLRDSRSKELIGTGQMRFDSLRKEEGTHQEWISLKDILGNEIGKALVEYEIKPQNQLMQGEFGSAEKVMGEMRRALDSMVTETNKMFDQFRKSYFPELTMGMESPKKGLMGESEKMKETGKIEPEKQSSTQGGKATNPKKM